MHLLLEYVQALVWPAVAVFAMVRFADPIKGLFRDRKAKTLPTPWGPVELEASKQEEQSQTPLALQAAEAAVTTEPTVIELWGQDLVEPIPLGHDTLKGGIAVLQTLSEIFHYQIDYLKLLQETGSGLTVGATLDWFKTRMPGELGQQLDHLTGFLLNRKLISIGEDGVYRLTERGAAFLQFESSLWYAQKAY